MDSAAGFLYWRTSCRYAFRFDYKRCLKVSIKLSNYKYGYLYNNIYTHEENG